MVLEWEIRVGLDITGKRLFSSNRSKYFEMSGCVDNFRRSILKSPEIISWQALSEGSVLIWLITEFKFLCLDLYLLEYRECCVWIDTYLTNTEVVSQLIDTNGYRGEDVLILTYENLLE